MAEKDKQIASLTADLEELKQLILRQQDEDEEEDKPKRRGRPPKVAADEATT